MELYRGRPEDVSGRLEREVRSYDLLDSLGMTYWRTDHPDMPAGNMEACNEVDAVLGVLICKNLFLCNRQRTSFYLLLMPGDKPFKTKELSAQINSSRLSFGSAEEMEELLGVSPGSVSVLGLMNDRARPPARGRGRAPGGVLRLPPLHQHLQPQAPHPRADGGPPARPGP